MRNFQVVLVAVVLMSLRVMSQASSEAELHRRFDAAVTRADATWRQQQSQPRDAASPYSRTAWTRGDMRLSVDCYVHDTEGDASQLARNLAVGSAVGFRAITGYGDEAFLIDSQSSLNTRLIVRRGAIVLSIGSRDGPAVLKFATVFLREIEQARREGLVR